MRIVFSRKGFDSGAGGVPSPIIGGKPVSLPIPTAWRSQTSYDCIGLGDLVEKATRGRIKRDHLCHEDPMFGGKWCLFGQCGAAQSHLANQGVTIGDVFLFFGLFADGVSGERHHRIFGFLKIGGILAGPCDASALPHKDHFPRAHPHTIGKWNANNTIYCGAGTTAASAHDALRLTQPGGPLGRWIVPPGLKECGLSFHRAADRWQPDNRLEAVARGQEFVADIDGQAGLREWLDRIVELIGR